MELYIYKREGERIDNDVHYSLKQGDQDDVAICRAISKEEAIIKFSKYFTDCRNELVFSIDELFWIESDNVSLLTPY